MYLLISTISATIVIGIFDVFRRKFSNCPRLLVGFFYFAKNLNFFLKSVDNL
nr:MAG TPA: hypothetical protein [Caudoviricetes sp.]